MMGMKAIEAARVFIEETGLTGLLTPAEFLEEREGMLQNLFPTCEKMPGMQWSRILNIKWNLCPPTPTPPHFFFLLMISHIACLCKTLPIIIKHFVHVKNSIYAHLYPPFISSNCNCVKVLVMAKVFLFIDLHHMV